MGDVMGDAPADEEIEAWHRRFAGGLYNRAWALIDKPDRTADEDDEMLAAAFGSRFHWGRVGNDENFAVGDWQIAHVCSHLGLGDLALRFASKALLRVEAMGTGGWLHASMLEGMARACAVSGDAAGRDRYIKQAEAVLATVDDEEDRKVIADQLATVPRD